MSTPEEKGEWKPLGENLEYWSRDITPPPGAPPESLEEKALRILTQREGLEIELESLETALDEPYTGEAKQAEKMLDILSRTWETLDTIETHDLALQVIARKMVGADESI